MKEGLRPPWDDAIRDAGLNKTVWEVITACWCQNPKERMDASTLSEHLSRLVPLLPLPAVTAPQIAQSWSCPPPDMLARPHHDRNAMKRSITTSPIPTASMSQDTLQTRVSHLASYSPGQSTTNAGANAGDQSSPELRRSESPSSPRTLLRRCGRVRHRDRRPVSGSFDTPLTHTNSLPSMYSPSPSETTTLYPDSPLPWSNGTLFSREPQQKEAKLILDEEFAQEKAQSTLPPLSPVRILDAKPLPPPLSHRSTSSTGSLHPDLVDLASTWPVSPSVNPASLSSSHPSHHERHALSSPSLPLPRNVPSAQPTEPTLILL